MANNRVAQSERRVTTAMPLPTLQTVRHTSLSRNARIARRVAQHVVRPVLKRVEISAEMFGRMRTLEQFKPRRQADGIVATYLDLGGVRAEAMRPAHLEVPDLTIMYFHGGGFFSGSIDSHRAL
jgi:acetyl esterase/lipase